MRIFILFIALSITSLGGVVHDYEKEISRLEKQSKDYSTTGMVLATQEYYEELDKVLNKEIAFAANLYSKKDGSIWRLSTPSVMTNLMENRIRELASYIGD